MSQQTVTLQAPQQADYGLGFFVHTITVQNASNGYWYLPNEQVYIVPYQTQTVVPGKGEQSARLVYQAPQGRAQPPVANGTITAIYSDSLVPPISGIQDIPQVLWSVQAGPTSTSGSVLIDAIKGAIGGPTLHITNLTATLINNIVPIPKYMSGNISQHNGTTTLILAPIISPASADVLQISWLTLIVQADASGSVAGGLNVLDGVGGTIVATYPYSLAPSGSASFAVPAFATLSGGLAISLSASGAGTATLYANAAGEITNNGQAIGNLTVYDGGNPTPIATAFLRAPIGTTQVFTLHDLIAWTGEVSAQLFIESPLTSTFVNGATGTVVMQGY